MAKKPAQAAAQPVEKERAQFTRLIAQNPNYFGNLSDKIFKPVKKIVGNTTYEDLTCVGYDPIKNLLEATIAIKLPFGYGGDLCSPGTTEYVRFFLDYGSGWEDVGLAAVNVHDIPTDKDCAGALDKPLIYVASLKLKPKTECCNHPVLPKVHAILSWQWMPPAGAANVGWLPPWGTTLDCNIQIHPHRWNILCLLDLINESVTQKIKVPPLFEEVKLEPIPLPDPPPYNLGELAKMYGPAPGVKGDELSVEPHRFGLADLHAAIGPGGFNQEMVYAKAAEWKAVGLDWASAVAALSDLSANVGYEEIECLGLDDNLERLVATFRIKRPTGYSGDLCHKGSSEFVAFWADWDDTCEWTYLGTVEVNVHDISTIPRPGLCYSAILPVDLTYHRRPCAKPKIGRVRAVLSWSVPPSTKDPEALNYWGNRRDAHVQINPGDKINPEKPDAKIRNLGGIPIEDIDTAGTGLTNVGDVRFAHHHWATADGWGLGRACPFGGNVEVEGLFLFGFYYRLRARKAADHSIVHTLDQDFYVERSDIGFDHQIAVGGWFKYLHPEQEFDRTLAVWSTSGDDQWEVQLAIATAPNDASIVSTSPWYRIQLDNTAPTVPVDPPVGLPTLDIHIAAGGDCKDFNENGVISGSFVARDLYFGGWSLSTEPNTVATPSNSPIAAPAPPPVVAALSNTSQTAPAPGGSPWYLDTGNPVHMKPCGYVVRLDASDRSIVHSVPFAHNSNHIEVGFCLRAKP